jgi:chemotaxis protein MotB
MKCRNWLPCLIASFLLAGCVSQKVHDALQADLAQTREALSTEKASAEDIAAQLADTQKVLLDCRNQVSVLETRNENLERNLDDLNLALAEINESCNEQMREMSFELDKQKSIIAMQSTVINRLDNTKKEIEESLKEQIEAKEIQIEEMENRLKVTLVDKILFNTGQAQVNPRGREVLAKVADSLKAQTSHAVVVEGHTDNVPIGSGLKNRFASNWELSAARAISVVRFLQEEGVDPTKVSAAAFGPYQPVGSNATAEGRSRNRRIEIILVPLEGR